MKVLPNSVDLLVSFSHFQGSTTRKRKLYESFLEKVSILGKLHQLNTLALVFLWCSVLDEHMIGVNCIILCRDSTL